MYDQVHSKLLRVMGQQKFPRIVGYIFMVLNGLISVCVFLGVKIPWLFATPSTFALAILSMLLMTFYLLGIAGESHLAIKLILTSYFFVVLLVFPHSFDFQKLSFSGFFSFDLYRMIVLILGSFTIQIACLLIFGRELPTLGWLIIVPVLLLLMHWFSRPETTVSEFKILGGVVLIGAVLGLRWGLLRG